MRDKFNLLVRSREGVIFRGEVNSITSFNEKGKFDVLSQHANFISLITNSINIIDGLGVSKQIPLNNALLRVRENYVEVYLGVQGLNQSNK
ncbi:hypothetical protein A2685_01235 [Candidatus Woesebacteria bacterium RIFCSPHIGHO2_01_FULL_37_10]|uniref:ATP synthase F1 complex delta/epsilon subunit N-terminal domain-containing protein n=1 Tax=Candidatus Woesebacteria bacterium RIFCSPHIGHO2_01_FULL_37_10 TaxID=1802489 RepID=A0A1F7XY98_9BACT|nr:MAG: hypothetical protein A2685_01235 [Candidatus Woesebacteria bacterium RIFCSPHIGHO2_01_FULL_37_10]